MERLAPLAALARRRPALAAIVLGLLGALAYPPLHLWPLGLAALAGFVWLIHTTADWRAAIWRGWWFGWAHLTLANNWIATAFTHQAKMPEFLGWLAVPLLCIYLAIYPAAASAAAHLLARRYPLWAFGMVLAGTWILAEWARATFFTGYPWPPLALMLLGGWETPGLARLLPWTGTYGLSGLAILLATALAALARTRRPWLSLIALAPAAALMHAPALGGSDQAGNSGVRYTLVQPYIPQSEINDGAKFEEQFARLSALSKREGEGPRVVLWPESAIPDYLEEGYPQRFYQRMTAGADPLFARRRIAAAIGPQSRLLTGVVNLDIERVGNEARAVSARNSVVAIDEAGAITHTYAKAHLVPYGEYLPLRAVLEPLGLSRLVAGSIDYRAGPGPRTLDLGEYGRAGVQICYEIVFSGRVVEPGNRPDFIFNPSNDGWFGAWGPPQHLGQARLRAIEEGLPVLRSTTTGISAVIDNSGIVGGGIATGQADALSGAIPAAAPPTLFARFGNWLALGWAVLLIGLGLAVPRLGPRPLALRPAQG
ncbi:MAG: apolipoprotein N-acyltransferase [Erythrobacter sp.]|jgi:apolipoprotein N-acyltransferase|nr:apolipoprotein N-acyltransferase [Erythrobacter sp.]